MKDLKYLMIILCDQRGKHTEKSAALSFFFLLLFGIVKFVTPLTLIQETSQLLPAIESGELRLIKGIIANRAA